jgi:Family of unknown function (DUF5335)
MRVTKPEPGAPAHPGAGATQQASRDTDEEEAMSTNTHELPAEEWHSYLDSFTEAASGMLVTAHVMDESLGDQIDIERLPLQAVSYDPRDDVLEVAVGGRGTRNPIVFRHLISAPRRVEVEERAALEPVAIEVTDQDGVRTLIRFYEPPELDA